MTHRGEHCYYAYATKDENIDAERRDAERYGADAGRGGDGYGSSEEDEDFEAVLYGKAFEECSETYDEMYANGEFDDEIREQPIGFIHRTAAINKMMTNRGIEVEVAPPPPGLSLPRKPRFRVPIGASYVAVPGRHGWITTGRPKAVNAIVAAANAEIERKNRVIEEEIRARKVIIAAREALIFAIAKARQEATALLLAPKIPFKRREGTVYRNSVKKMEVNSEADFPSMEHSNNKCADTTDKDGSSWACKPIVTSTDIL